MQHDCSWVVDLDQCVWCPTGVCTYTLVQVHNQIAAELHYSEHCYREHFVSVPLGLMLVHATNFVNEISPSATDALYIVQ